jgi:hypothetical protein
VTLKTELTSFYRNRVQECTARLNRLKQVETALIAAKLAVAACAAFLLYQVAATSQERYLYLLAAAAVLFVFPAVIHEHYIRRRKFLNILWALNETEIRALSYEFPDFDDGRSYANPDHPFSADLDIFGPRGVFHYINRTTTNFGTECLADWMQAHPGGEIPSVCKARQEAVSELSGKIDLRQRVQAHGRQIKESLKKPNAFPQLMAEPNLLLKRRMMIWAIHLLPMLTLTTAGLAFYGLHWGLPLGLLLVHAAINRRNRKVTHRIAVLTAQNARVFKAYARIIREIEAAQFENPCLRSIQDRLHTNDKPASRHIRRISNLAALFELRRSEILHPVFNTLFLWDLHCVLRLERWKSRYLEAATEWLKILGEFESLSSFANLAFNHRDWSFPEIDATGSLFKAESMGHFLIPPDERVCNDFQAEGAGTILIVTGPNMAGKSTFLKTIGVNLVLGLAGAPVCARRCRFSPFKLYTSMKVSDSLDKHLSLFYAELQRLKMILDVIVEGERVFFLLDEVLKGTNALDRQAGAVALLRQLVGYGALGAVATHDLELTKLEKEIPSKIKNAHFDGIVEGDRLLFDYRLQPGKCTSFNALALMRKIGIDI